MWGDKGWGGWVKTPLVSAGDGWYSFDLANGITAGYNMLIFFNGLPDEDANAIQWVWHVDRGAPAGNYFIADKAKGTNPNENNFKGVQYDATAFATKADAEAALAVLGVTVGTPKTGVDPMFILAAAALILASGTAVIVIRKVKA